jgi:outer membrane lipoprotein SlyB
MKKKMLLLCAVTLLMGTTSLYAGTVESIQYGTVVDIGVTQKDASHAGGALAGGVLGAFIGPNRHRGLKMLGGAMAGAAIQGAATSGELQQYTVNMMNGGTVKISTEQVEIREGDCVAVEQGQNANIRRVSTIHCEPDIRPELPPAHHISAANNCQLAKNELAKAETDAAVNTAAKKVRILCED